MKTQGIVALLLALLAAPAMASHCPTIMSDIDELLNDDAVVSALDGSDLDQVRELRAEGEELHESGSHEKSVETLNEALDILQGAGGSSGSSGYSY